MIKLTDENIGGDKGFSEWYQWFILMMSKKEDMAEKNAIMFLTRSKATSQLRRVAEWGNRTCLNPGHSGVQFSETYKQHECPECWQELMKEVGEPPDVKDK